VRTRGECRTPGLRCVKTALSPELRGLDVRFPTRIRTWNLALNRGLLRQLSYRELCSADGTRTRKMSRVKAGRLYQFAHRAVGPHVLRDGIEPPTLAMSGRCSAS
jgi:hypothetical protein